MNILQDPRFFIFYFYFYDDSIDKETEDIDDEIPYVDPAECAREIV